MDDVWAAIGFKITNPVAPNGGAVIYTTGDPALQGTIELTLQNKTASAILLPSTAKIIVGFYNGFLTPSEIAGITTNTPGWKATQNQGLGDTWAESVSAITLQPLAEATLAPKGTLTIALNRVVASGRAGPCSVAVGIGGFAGLPASPTDFRAALVFVLRPPSAIPRPLPITIGLVPRPPYYNTSGLLYVTDDPASPAHNFIDLALAPATAEKIVLGKARPQFYVSFLTGTARGALCRDTNMPGVTAAVEQDDNSPGWWTAPLTDAAGAAVWTLMPRGESLFETNSPVVFRFNNIVAEPAQGETSAALQDAADPTTIFVHHYDVPGYDDGYASLALSKAPFIGDFELLSGGTPVDLESTPVVPWADDLALSWSTFTLADCALALNGQAVQPARLPSAMTSFPIVPPDTLQTHVYELAANAFIGYVNARFNKSIRFSFAPRAVVDTFEVVSTDAVNPSAATPGNVTVKWSCRGGEPCQLLASGDPSGKTGQPVKLDVTLSGTQDVALIEPSRRDPKDIVLYRYVRPSVAEAGAVANWRVAQDWRLAAGLVAYYTTVRPFTLTLVCPPDGNGAVEATRTIEFGVLEVCAPPPPPPPPPPAPNFQNMPNL